MEMMSVVPMGLLWLLVSLTPAMNRRPTVELSLRDACQALGEASDPPLDGMAQNPIMGGY